MAIALKLRPVLHPKGDRNQYCGPSAISALTGMGTGEAARLLRAVSRKASIKGTHNIHMLRALTRCGIRTVDRWAPVEDLRPTLAQWLRATAGKRGGKVMLVLAGNHYQLVSGNRFVCGQTGEVVGFDHPKVKRRRRVEEVWTLEARDGVTIPAEARKPKAGPDTAAQPRTAAKRLAAAWGVEIEQHRDLESRPWFVSHPMLDDEDQDPHYGDHYAHEWPEVLARVRDYVAALKARGIGPVG